MKRRYLRADAAFACPEIYELLAAEGCKHMIRVPAIAALQESTAWPMKHPGGRRPHEVRRYHASFRHQAGSWSKPRRVMAKVEWHPDELYPRVGFTVADMASPAEQVVAFRSQRGTAEQYIKEGETAVTWTRLSCIRFAANADPRRHRGTAPIAATSPMLSVAVDIGRAGGRQWRAASRYRPLTAIARSMGATDRSGATRAPASHQFGFIGS